MPWRGRREAGDGKGCVVCLAARIYGTLSLDTGGIETAVQTVEQTGDACNPSFPFTA